MSRSLCVLTARSNNQVVTLLLQLEIEGIDKSNVILTNPGGDDISTPCKDEQITSFATNQRVVTVSSKEYLCHFHHLIHRPLARLGEHFPVPISVFLATIKIIASLLSLHGITFAFTFYFVIFLLAPYNIFYIIIARDNGVKRTTADWLQH